MSAVNHGPATIQPADTTAEVRTVDSMRTANEAILICYSNAGRRFEPHEIDKVLVALGKIPAQH